MQLGVIGLGRMGANIARRLHRAGHHCVVYNRTAKPVAELAAEGLTPASDILDLVKKLDPPRAVWIMLPAGAVTEGMIDAMSELVSAGDILIDGGNTFYKLHPPITLRRRYWPCGISPGTTPALARILAAASQPSKRAGIEFIEENGGGPGVRLKKSKRKRDNRDTALALM